MLNKDIFNLRYLLFALISISLFTLMIINEKHYGQFHTDDFRVFYLAAKALISGQSVYGVPFGLDTGFYKYSPFTLLLFTAYTFIPYKIASIIHFAIVALSGILSIITLERLIDRHLFKINKKGLLLLIFILLGVLIHLIRDLHMGNTNTILVLLLILALKLSLESREILAGVLLALAILTKPYFIILMLPLLLSKKYKTILSTAVAGIGFTLITGIFIGFSKSILLHTEWVMEMLRHSIYLSSTYTLPYLLHYYLGIGIPTKLQFPFFGLAVMIVSFYFWYQQNNKNILPNNYAKNLVFFYFILIAIIPSFLITDVEHFIFSLPLIAILVFYLKNKNNYFWTGLFVIVVLLFAGNSSDLVGNVLSYKIKIWGWVGIGNLLILTGSFLTFKLLQTDNKSNKSN